MNLFSFRVFHEALDSLGHVVQEVGVLSFRDMHVLRPHKSLRPFVAVHPAWTLYNIEILGQDERFLAEVLYLADIFDFFEIVKGG